MFSSSCFREIPNLIKKHHIKREENSAWQRKPNLRLRRLDLVDLPLELMPCRRRSRGSRGHLFPVKTQQPRVTHTAGSIQY